MTFTHRLHIFLKGRYFKSRCFKRPYFKSEAARWSLTVLLSLFFVESISANPDCGTVHLVKEQQVSAELLANVDKLILEKGFKCSVVEQKSDNVTDTLATLIAEDKPAFSSVHRSSALPANQTDDSDDAGADTLRSINDTPVTDAGAGWWITPGTLEKHPELITVLDVLEHPELFADPDNPQRGIFVGCPAERDCQTINENLFQAFDMQAKGWNLINPSDRAALDDSLNRAIENDQNWFGYHWSPSALTGRHNMVKLGFGIEFAGVSNWNSLSLIHI